MKKITLLSGFVFAILISKAQTINTMAGNGGYGYNGDNIPATAAELTSPESIATDDSGNVYIADLTNNRIRKVSSITGLISTVAGDGVAGYSGDGALAVAAEINTPSGVAVDSSFNIYIADYQNNLVRKVNKLTGIITTIAGNGTNGYSGDGMQATDAELAFDEDVSVDDSANVYITDTYNYRIRKLTNSTGIITTIIGNGINSYSGDGGQATAAEIGHTEKAIPDKNGNIYFSDENNGRVRYVDKSTGIITTLCGNGIAAFSGAGGPATAAEVNYPEGLALDAAGNLYFVDLYDEHALMIDRSSGILTIYAGNGIDGFSGDGGPATAAELNAPSDIVIDKSGNLYIGDQGNRRVRGNPFINLGIPLISTGKAVAVYPIPTSGTMTVQLPGKGYNSIKVFDELGGVVYTQLLDASKQDRVLDLNIGNVSNGIYIMQINSEKGNTGKRIVIEK